VSDEGSSESVASRAAGCHAVSVGDHRALASAFVDGVAAASARDIAACFAPDARLRGLIPPGPVERIGALAVGELIASWFADSEPLTLTDSSIDQVGDRLHISYRFEGTELGEDFTVQQQVYAEIVDGRLKDVTLLCSGFRPRQRAG
jgi:hypothetical protein